MKVFNLVNQDNKPSMPIIYEAIEREKLAIKILIKRYQKY